MSFVCNCVFEFIIFLSYSLLYSSIVSISFFNSPISFIVFVFCVLILRSISEILIDNSSFLWVKASISLAVSEILLWIFVNSGVNVLTTSSISLFNFMLLVLILRSISEILADVSMFLLLIFTIMSFISLTFYLNLHLKIWSFLKLFL